MNFDALFEGNRPQGLINGLWEVDGGMYDPGPELSAYGPRWAAWAWGWGLGALGHEENSRRASWGLTEAILSVPGLKHTVP